MNKLSDAEIQTLAQQLPAWTVVNNHRLERSFDFPDFLAALNWVNRAALVAEQQAHHPDLHLSWGKVRVEIWTHSASGLTSKDIELAHALDRIVVAP